LKLITFALFCAMTLLVTQGITAQTSAQGLFAPAVTYPSGGSISYSVAVADVNGDGKPDLLVTSFCVNSSNCDDGAVAVLLGNGDGTFQAAVTYSSGAEVTDSIAVADVNGDGKPDLVLGNGCASSVNCQGSVSVLLGNGDGTFQTAVSYPPGGLFSHSVVVADVNGDGKPDLVVANQCDSSTSCANGTVGILLGNGDGTFQTAASYVSGAHNAFSVAVADVNGDGKPDLLVTNILAIYTSPADLTGSVDVLMGNGDGTFNAAVPYDSGGQLSYFVAVADVDGDGKPDLVVTNFCASGTINCGSSGSISTGSVSVLLGNGDGTFKGAVPFSSSGYGAFSVAVADVNGDGKPDLLVTNLCISSSNCANGTAGVLLGNGDGTFQAPVTYSSGGVPARSVAVADVNGDGKPDLVVANECGSNITCDSSTKGSVGVLLNISTPPYKALVQRPINPDGSSIFNAKRGVIPVKFTLTQNGTQTCALPPATISVAREGPIDETSYVSPADNGSNFRIDGCQYIYNLTVNSLGVGAYRVDISINGQVVGSGSFALK
jgi:hypothetical protein